MEMCVQVGRSRRDGDTQRKVTGKPRHTHHRTHHTRYSKHHIVCFFIRKTDGSAPELTPLVESDVLGVDVFIILMFLCITRLTRFSFKHYTAVI